MPGKNFHDIDTMAFLFAVAGGTWGSILSFLKRERRYKSILRAVSVFLFDMFTSMGFTVLTYLGLCGYGVNELLSVSVSGFIGYQGTRGFYLLELAIADKIGSKSMAEEIKKDM